ncbi:MAG: TetR/AcrR family transcriptional regulator [Clostridium sp.]|nr:TetR/AcrR family transcriptional regulator [Clostridium sp.]MCM1398175.1 TetR/AcrR family transcriptional regulator [Clostridium sp.]MCM1460994.1 TetR/AcrR family transcriptional regulator [Bacteroides sp.]
MAESFVSRKDRIIASAIEIISESGLSALTTHNLAIKENMSDGLLYKYFAGIDEVLVEVVDYYFRFDDSLRQTIDSKDEKYTQKLYDYLEAYVTYYDNYYALSTLMLQYEELLHNIYTREKVSKYATDRIRFLEKLFREAALAGEIIDTLTPEELANHVTGLLMAHILNRRIIYNNRSFKNEIMNSFNKWLSLIKVSD